MASVAISKSATPSGCQVSAHSVQGGLEFLDAEQVVEDVVDGPCQIELAKDRQLTHVGHHEICPVVHPGARDLEHRRRYVAAGDPPATVHHRNQAESAAAADVQQSIALGSGFESLGEKTSGPALVHVVVHEVVVGRGENVVRLPCRVARKPLLSYRLALRAIITTRVL